MRIEADTIKALQDRQMEEAQLPDPEVIETEETVEVEAVEEERAMPGIGNHQRAEATTFDQVEDRTYEFPFSSEFPVARYFGNEILSHEMDAADLSRLNDGAPLLFNHNPDRVIGVVERAYIDGKKKRGYARVRFSRKPIRSGSAERCEGRRFAKRLLWLLHRQNGGARRW
jgi:hypothetical protein